MPHITLVHHRYSGPSSRNRFNLRTSSERSIPLAKHLGRCHVATWKDFGVLRSHRAGSQIRLSFAKETQDYGRPCLETMLRHCGWHPWETKALHLQIWLHTLCTLPVLQWSLWICKGDWPMGTTSCDLCIEWVNITCVCGGCTHPTTQRSLDLFMKVFVYTSAV